MTSRKWSRRARIGLLAAGAGLIAGCQTYEARPLAMGAYAESMAARLRETEPLRAFAVRVAVADPTMPGRFDLSDGLSPAEGEVLALFYQPDLRLARLRAGGALDAFEHAGLWEDPVFGFDGAEILSPSGPFEFGLTLGLTIPVSGRLGVERDRAGAAYGAELLRVVDEEWTVRARVRSAWGAWYGATERVSLLREVVGQVEQIGEITDRLASVGELTRTEARLLRAELIGVRSALNAAEFEESRARRQLLGLMGLRPDADVVLERVLPSCGVAGVDDPVGRLIAANTALAVRRAEYRTAEQALRLAIREQYPDISIGGGFGSEGNDDRLLLGVSVPIPLFNRNRAGIAEASARRGIARATAEAAFEQALRELEDAQGALAAARLQRAAFASELVPLLDEQFAEIGRLMELGEVDTLILLETVTRRFEAKSGLLDVRLAELNACIEVGRLLGPDGPVGPVPVAEPAEGADGAGVVGVGAGVSGGGQNEGAIR